jgi:hypothetical protein
MAFAFTKQQLQQLEPTLFPTIFTEYFSRIFMSAEAPHQLPVNWAELNDDVFRDIVSTDLTHLGHCLGSLAAYMVDEESGLGVPPAEAAGMISEQIGNSAFAIEELEVRYSSDSTSPDKTYLSHAVPSVGGNPQDKSNWNIANAESLFMLDPDAIMAALMTGTYNFEGGEGPPEPPEEPEEPPTSTPVTPPIGPDPEEPFDPPEPPPEEPSPPPYAPSAPASLGMKVTDDTGVLIEPDSELTYGAMGGVTSYSIVEGEFYLKSLPQPDAQYVKKTVQGISDTFTYESDDLSLNSIINESDMVKVTEMVYQGEVNRVMNKSSSVVGTMGLAPASPYNRVISEYSSGAFQQVGAGGYNLSSSTCDDIIAIAVDDIKPFMLKSLDINHNAQFREHKTGNYIGPNETVKYIPTNEAYIKHLTPDKNTRVALITTPAYLVANGVPPIIEVHYDAIDLTGEVVAGTGIANPHTVVNDYAKPWITGDGQHKGHLVVRKTFPAGSQAYEMSTGAIRPLADLLKRPWDISGATPAASEIGFQIIAPGGIVSIPAKNLNKPLKSNVLTSAPSGEITPSPFINLDDCLVNNRYSYRGFGRPKAIPSTVVPDPDTSADYHLLRVSSSAGSSDYIKKKESSVFSSASNRAFDVIDNDITSEELLVLVHPTSRGIGGGLDGLITEPSNPSESHLVHLEYTLMKGRIEEIEPGTSTSASAGITVRGRSLLMDLSDQKTERDFKLSEGTPLKEIGDLGTPTVSLSLGGPGQGAIDVKPSRIQHPIFPGWKDRIVGAGNASVRNDKQSSTYYASTRALVELPLFPSMFYDTKKILYPDADNQPLPTEKGFGMTIDCTMTAMNRPEMKNQEGRFSIDWGIDAYASSFEVTDSIYKHSLPTGDGGQPGLTVSTYGALAEVARHRPLIRCQRPSVTAVVESVDGPSSTITVDNADGWDSLSELGLQLNDLPLTGIHCITIGEGLLGGKMGYVAKVTRVGNTFTIDALWSMSKTDRITEASSIAAASLNDITPGMTVVLGGYVCMTSLATDSWNLAVSAHNSHTKEDIAYSIAHKIGFLFGRGVSATGGQDITRDETNVNKYWLRGVPSMEAFDYDCDEALYSFSDRPLVLGVDCKPSALSLQGKSSDGLSTKYIRPMDLDFNGIATTKKDFNSCFDEVIRKINLAAHPAAKNDIGFSAFDAPNHFDLDHLGEGNTGSHMGYVRAFEGKEVESRNGEKGKTIVIHSTIPGATARNFAIWLDNRSPYPYQPVACIGSGGLLATNSLHYQANSFPAPLPIGSDGETFVPITTFTGGSHGRLLSPYNEQIRSYTGVGQTIVTTTIQPTLSDDDEDTTITGDYIKMVVPRRPTTGQTMFGSLHALAGFNAANSPPIDYIAVDNRAYEGLLTLGSEISAANRGIGRVNGRMFWFEGISQLSNKGLRITNGVLLRNITPWVEIEKFYDSLFIKDSLGVETDALGLSVEILWPLVNSKGILFFGGGHTGVMVDVSDGSSNDYSDSYRHHYSKGPTGFAGMQNLHETNKASAVLDFTLIKDHDTINENSYIGLHHKSRIRPSTGQPIDDCLLYLSMVEENPLPYAASYTTEYTAAYPQNDETVLKEEIYGRYQKLSVPAGKATLTATSPTGHTKFRPIQFIGHTGAGPWPTTGYPYLVCHDWDNTGVGEAFASLPHLGPRSGIGGEISSEVNRPLSASKPFTVSFFFMSINGGPDAMSGPIIHGIDASGLPWGVSMGGANTSALNQEYNFALHYADLTSGQPRFAYVDVAAYMAAHGGSPLYITNNEWHHCVFVHDGNQSGLSMATCKLIIDGVDLSAFLVTDQDALYDGTAPNSRTTTSGGSKYPRHEHQGSPTSEGVADHPYVPLENGQPSTVDPTKGVRGNCMATVGVALHGAPHNGSHYFDQAPSVIGSSTYGTPQVVPATDGHNDVGPIFLKNGSLAHIGVWDRAFTVLEAQGLYASRLVW